jgi:hypothetical protein
LVMGYRSILVVLALIISTAALGYTQPQTKTTTLLAKFDSRTDSQTLAQLFRIGDRRITDLISALSSKDELIRTNAQIVIRYVANKDGMDSLGESYAANASQTITGIVPAPLREWDYALLERFVFCKDCRPREPFVPGYVYALTLDQSDRAKQTLSRLQALLGNIKLVFDEVAPLKVRSKNSKDLGRELRRRSFFLETAERKNSRVRLLSFSEDKTKALYEVYVDNGVLAEKWFHIVLVNDGEQWRFLSVSLAAQS